MKKFVALFVFLFAATLTGIAQENYDVVYLKNGSVVKGIITELWPYDYLNIETTGGRVRTIEMDEVKKIEKERGKTAAGTQNDRRQNDSQTQRSTPYSQNNSQNSQNNNRYSPNSGQNSQNNNRYSQNGNRYSQSGSQYSQNNNRNTQNDRYAQNNNRYSQYNQYPARNRNYGYDDDDYYTPRNSIHFGIKSGLNLASTSDEEDKYKAGMHGGIFGEFRFDRFAIQPELLFSMQGTKGTVAGYGIKVKAKVNLNYLNIPVMAKFYVSEGFSLEVGPQLGILLSAKVVAGVDGSSASVDIKEGFKDVDCSLASGASYQLPELPLGFYMRYSLGLTDIIANNKGDAVKNSVFQLGAFVKF